jgi:hypothetical protein
MFRGLYLLTIFATILPFMGPIDGTNSFSAIFTRDIKTLEVLSFLILLLCIIDIRRQVALNFITRHPDVFTIPKTSHSERARENSGGTGLELIEKDILAIERAFPVQESDMPQQMI